MKHKLRKSPYDKLETSKFNVNLNHLWLLPLTVAVIPPIMCITLYPLALLNGHVAPILPYISDIGSVYPEAGIFSELLSIAAVFVLLTTYARYKQLDYCIQVKLSHKHNIDPSLIVQLKKRNLIANLISFGACIGLLTISSFRVSEWLILHALGAAIAFPSILVYSYLMINICNHLSKFGIESPPTSMKVITALNGVCVFACSTFSNLSMSAAKDHIYDNEFRMKWNRNQEGYWWHVAGTTFEWLLLNAFSLFLLCLCSRMRMFKEWNKLKLF